MPCLCGFAQSFEGPSTRLPEGQKLSLCEKEIWIRLMGRIEFRTGFRGRTKSIRIIGIQKSKPVQGAILSIARARSEWLDGPSASVISNSMVLWPVCDFSAASTAPAIIGRWTVR